MSIIISSNGRNAKKIDKSTFDKEDYLQNYIHQNPESIPVYEIREDKRLLVVAREFSTESGPIDALAIDKDGDIYIVETKLYKNPDKRTVVAQALDYGASLWKHLNDFGEFIEKIEKAIQNNFNISFQEKSKDFFGFDDEQFEILKEAIRRNLNDGNLKFVILMDSMDERLKDLIIYVNQNSQFDIYAVELEYYKYEQYEIIIPKIFGVEVKKSISSHIGSKRGSWTQEKFFSEAAKTLDSKQLLQFQSFYEGLKKIADSISWGSGTNVGSFSPIIDKIDPGRSLISIFSNGKLAIKFSWFNKKEREIKTRDMFKELLVAHARPLNIPSDYTNLELRKNLEEWIDSGDGILQALAELKRRLE